MDILKKLFPFSFGINDVSNLVVRIIVYFAASAVVGILLGIFFFIPVLGWLLSAVGSLVGLYSLIGIVLVILDYCKVIK